jgi:hypothetical protein
MTTMLEGFIVKPISLPQTPYEFLLRYTNVDDKSLVNVTWEDINRIGAMPMFTRILQCQAEPQVCFAKDGQ